MIKDTFHETVGGEFIEARASKKKRKQKQEWKT